MVEQLQLILKEFEPYFNCPLAIDANNSCLIRMGIGISIQIELNPQNQLLIGCKIGALPRGKYRKDILKAALHSNYLDSPLTGMFGFSTKTTHLIFFLLLEPHLIARDNVAEFLDPFIAKARKWADFLAREEVPSLSDLKDS